MHENLIPAKIFAQITPKQPCPPRSNMNKGFSPFSGFFTFSSDRRMELTLQPLPLRPNQKKGPFLAPKIIKNPH